MDKGKLIGQGNTAEIYEYHSDKILKLYRQGIPEELCENEFNITKNINISLGVCPKAFEIIWLDGRIGAIYEKIEGKTMLKKMVSKFWVMDKYSKLLANYHYDIQKNVDFKLPTVKKMLSKNIEMVKELSESEKNKILKYIDSLPDGDTLCHFDFHPDNIIIRNGTPIIIDWMTACVGDKAADVARTVVMLKYAEVPIKSNFIKKIIKKNRDKIYKSYLEEYLKITNVDISDIQKWEMPIAAARLCELVPQEEKKRLITLVRERI